MLPEELSFIPANEGVLTITFSNYIRLLRLKFICYLQALIEDICKLYKISIAAPFF